MVIDRTLLYSIPFIRKRINEREGVTDYKSLSKIYKIPKSAFIHNELSIFIFVLPIFAVLNGVTIIISNPLKRLYTQSPVFIVLFISVFLISFFLDNYFFWNEDRYLTFFPSFKKEHIIKRLANKEISMDSRNFCCISFTYSTKYKDLLLHYKCI